VNEVERLRLFVAVSLPGSYLEWLERKTRELREHWPSARWAAIANQHITLKFLGSTPSDRLEAIRKVCGLVAGSHRPSEVRLSALGVFPSSKRVRVLWVGLDDPASLLSKVAADLGQAFEPLGYEVEERSFKAHLTLARWREPVVMNESFPDLDTSGLGPFEVDAIELFRSHLSPKGARYEVMESFRLGGTFS
jgi:RNA 2',3'-cyclic 3'-phosphodiesterase